MVKPTPQESWPDSHQPYEDWLFSEDPLTSEQSQALQQHLESCAACRQLQSSWNSMVQLFTPALQASPEPGFAARWQERQALESLRSHRRQTWIMLLLTAAITAFFLLLLAVQVFQALRSPYDILMYLASRVISLFALADTTTDFFSTLSRVIPGIVPLPLIIVVSGGLSLLCVLWFVSISYTKLGGFKHD